MSEAFESVVCTRPAEHVLQITLNRPDVGNALNTKMGEELRDLFTREPGDLRCIVLTGAGEKIFCGGGDLKQRNGMSNETWLAQHRIFEQFYWAMMDYPVPLICAVNGHAFGGGLEMVLAADFAYAVPAAKFALTETKLGIMPGGGGTQNLPRAVGERRAKELIFSAKPFTAAEALAWGVLNRICTPETLLAECLETAAAIAANGPLAVRQAKKAIHHGLQTDLSRGLWLEVEAYNRLVFTEDRLEGVRAFNEKRPAKFKGQ
ncbi:MAG: enoyl-CoA hydratase/isomerase family protein [Rhodospirillaceae bacterium]|nr:enoyl-CoA hydratase/isomerase family protein [Rhodospirillaceae bacterium]